MMVNVMMWFLQTGSRWRKMQENWSTYICSILTCCKPSHNLVSMAHKNEKLILIFNQMVAAMIFASVWPMWILSKIKISCFHVAKISKNWTLKKSGKSQKISLLVTRGNPDPPQPFPTKMKIHTHIYSSQNAPLLEVLEVILTHIIQKSLIM